MAKEFFVHNRDFYKSFFGMTIVIALQNAIVFAVNLADAIMLSRYSETALSGVALLNQVQFLLQMMVFGIAEGALIFSARSWGQKNIGAIHEVINIALKFSLATGIIMSVIAIFMPEKLLGLITSDKAIIAEGARYARIIGFSYPVFAVSQILMIMLRSVETVKVSFYVSTITFVINVTLNYMLIYGNFGFPEMGCRGAAVATLCARSAELVLTIAYCRMIDRKVKLRLHHILNKMNRIMLKDYIRIGTPVFLAAATWGIAMGIQTGILGHMGSSAIAANSVATTVFQFITVFIAASASAAAVITGKTIGERRYWLIRPNTRTFQVLFIITGICSAAVLFLLRYPIITVFSKLSPEAVDLSLQFMTVLSVTTIGTSYQMPSLVGIVRAGGETDFVLKNDFIFMWLIVLPASLLAAFYFHASPLIVFICLKADQVLKCAVAAVKLNRYTWIKRISTAK